MFRSLLLTSLFVAALPATSATLPNQPIDKLDLARYSGQWHEIAHLPMYFERKCSDTVIAVYTPETDGTIRAHYSCHTKAGKIDTVNATAKAARDPPDGAFKVRFVPGWLAWLPKTQGDYWVIDLATDYRWALIGGPSGKHLWIMSRDADMDSTLFEKIKDSARQRGYAVDQLILTAPLR
jgi:apolipoprotein D and lipocalin family protein